MKNVVDATGGREVTGFRKGLIFIYLRCFGKEVRKGKAKSPNMFRMRFVWGRKSLRVEEGRSCFLYVGLFHFAYMLLLGV
jgi:hypothetical protein